MLYYSPLTATGEHTNPMPGGPQHEHIQSTFERQVVFSKIAGGSHPYRPRRSAHILVFQDRSAVHRDDRLGYHHCRCNPPHLRPAEVRPGGRRPVSGSPDNTFNPDPPARPGLYALRLPDQHCPGVFGPTRQRDAKSAAAIGERQSLAGYRQTFIQVLEPWLRRSRCCPERDSAAAQEILASSYFPPLPMPGSGF